MDKNDIKRLIDCRKAIQEHRERKLEARKYEKSDYNKMQSGLADSLNTFNEDLTINGFTSLDEFLKFNEIMCMLALRECLPMKTGCDRCKGYKGDPPCVVTDGCPAFYDKWEDTEEWEDRLFQIIMYIWRNSEVYPNGTFKKLMKELPVQETGDFNKGGFSICPEGHGFTFGFNGMPPFDLNWK
jgi:hypothetical protein